jgi:ABC-type transporter Mla MlaB component
MAERESIVSAQVDESEAIYALRLDGEAGIEGAVELKEYLLLGLASGRALNVNLEGVTQVDVTALQLLWVAKHEAEAAGTIFGVNGRVPAGLLATLDEAGLENFLMEAK